LSKSRGRSSVARSGPSVPPASVRKSNGAAFFLALDRLEEAGAFDKAGAIGRKTLTSEAEAAGIITGRAPGVGRKGKRGT
jgi:hypothetical protein